MVPTRLAIPSIHLEIGYDQNSSMGTVASSRVDGQWTITPPEATWADLQSGYWWSEQRYSALPGNPSAGTTFIFLHACAQVRCAGNRVHELRKGNVIELSTPAGVLHYTVEQKLLLDKTPQGVGNNAVLYSYGHANQLRIVTCGYAADGSSPFNWAVIAALKG
jgi:hypothetical protein